MGEEAGSTRFGKRVDQGLEAARVV